MNLKILVNASKGCLAFTNARSYKPHSFIIVYDFQSPLYISAKKLFFWTGSI